MAAVMAAIFLFWELVLIGSCSGSGENFSTSHDMNMVTNTSMVRNTNTVPMP